MSIYLKSPAACAECGFATRDIHLLSGHSCHIQESGGSCEDFPACGHEYGDCNGLKYGSDESIKAYAMEHFDCDHEVGIYNCDTDYDEGCYDEDCEVTGVCVCY